MEQWFNSSARVAAYIYFPLFLFWGLWILRNHCVFENGRPSHSALISRIEGFLNSYPAPLKSHKIRNIGREPLKVFPCGFFDGAATDTWGCSYSPIDQLVSSFPHQVGLWKKYQYPSRVFFPLGTLVFFQRDWDPQDTYFWRLFSDHQLGKRQLIPHYFGLGGLVCEHLWTVCHVFINWLPARL